MAIRRYLTLDSVLRLSFQASPESDDMFPPNKTYYEILSPSRTGPSIAMDLYSTRIEGVL